jgi:hypothetical protein
MASLSGDGVGDLIYWFTDSRDGLHCMDCGRRDNSSLLNHARRKEVVCIPCFANRVLKSKVSGPSTSGCYVKLGVGYVLVKPRRNRRDELVEGEHVVLFEDVRRLWGIIKRQEKGVAVPYRVLVEQLISTLGLHIHEDVSLSEMVKSFNGGSNRAEFYFPLWYYPLKVLEAKGFVKYSGRGAVTRLRGGDLPKPI